jgi:hypothetical protein
MLRIIKIIRESVRVRDRTTILWLTMDFHITTQTYNLNRILSILILGRIMEAERVQLQIIMKKNQLLENRLP